MAGAEPSVGAGLAARRLNDRAKGSFGIGAKTGGVGGGKEGYLLHGNTLSRISGKMSIRGLGAFTGVDRELPPPMATIDTDTDNNIDMDTGIPPCVVIAGPTASGKSALALSIAALIGGEIVNADSMQVYRDLPVLTAIPDAADRQAVPHHGYAMIDGADRHSMARWLDDTRGRVAGIRARGRVPMLVGGTGMYLRAAMEGIAPLPDVPGAIRQQATAMLAEMGGAGFRAELRLHDPVLADRLDDGDSQRLIRGMEVFMATGQPLSQWQDTRPEGMIPGSFLCIKVEPPRDILYSRINRRFPQMLEQGAIDEAKAIASRQLDPSLPLMKAVGLPPILAMLEGSMTHDEMVELACRDTRRLAKRQMTWFRNQYRAEATLDGNETAQFLESFLPKILP
jgi:tRNA dimethylallyltransferase